MISSVQAELPRILELYPSLTDIAKTDWEKDGVQLIELEPNFMIEEGQFLEHAVLLLEGTVRMFKISQSGREVTLYRINGGECCPLMMTSILGETEYEATACVEITCLALVIPATMFRQWMDHYSSFRQFIFKMVAKRLILMSNLLDSISFKSVPGRVAEYLHQMTSAEKDTLYVTHDAISTELGTAREVISRTLKSFENEGIVKLSRGKITQINRQKLENYLEY